MKESCAPQDSSVLINASDNDTVRVVCMSGDDITNFEIVSAEMHHRIGNIYNATVKNVAFSLEAAFLDIGLEQNGFLPFKQVRVSTKSSSCPLSVGQTILVQLERDSIGTKGPALTSFISLAGTYVVLLPFGKKNLCITKRASNADKVNLRELREGLLFPDDMGIILRTSAVGKKLEDLQWDLDLLLNTWEEIKKAGKNRRKPCLIYREGSLVMRTLRDSLQSGIKKIVIDDEKTFQEARQYLERTRPAFIEKLELYQGSDPLFSFYGIESKIENIYSRSVLLPSGGEIVINRTEAFVAIDVNSARNTTGGNIEETALKTNLEAADAIALQARLRDLGGLIVIDFIDMASAENRSRIAQRVSEAFASDRAKVQVGKISDFGILEMSRQRLLANEAKNFHVLCPNCSGQGIVRSVSTLAVSILHILSEDAVKPYVEELHVYAALDVSTYLSNELRESLYQIEIRNKIRIIILPNIYLPEHQYRVEIVYNKEKNASTKNSNTMLIKNGTNTLGKDSMSRKNAVPEESPVVKLIIPLARKRSNMIVSFLRSMWKSLFSKNTVTKRSSARRRVQGRRNPRLESRSSGRRSSSPSRKPPSQRKPPSSSSNS